MLYGSIISNKDSTIAQYMLKDAANASLVENHKRENKNLLEQGEIWKKASQDLNRSLRRQKTKTVVAPIISTVITATVMYFLNRNR